MSTSNLPAKQTDDPFLHKVDMWLGMGKSATFIVAMSMERLMRYPRVGIPKGHYD